MLSGLLITLNVLVCIALIGVVLTREICDWHRFNNRRAISSYTGALSWRTQQWQQTGTGQRD